MPDPLSPGDQTVDDGELLYRRIFPGPDSLQPNSGGDGYRPSSGSLKSDLPLSVDCASLCTPEETRDRDLSKLFHVALISVSVVRAVGCRVVADPEDGNPAHALIYGSGKNGSLSKSETQKIARQSRIILVNNRAMGSLG